MVGSANENVGPTFMVGQNFLGGSMSTPVAGSDDSTFRRMLLGFALGALGGFACAFIVAFLVGLDFMGEPLSANLWIWPKVLRFAVLQAAPLGAAYVSLASISLLRAEKLPPVTSAALIVSVLFCLVARGFELPFAPMWLAASLGFWITCIVINARRSGRRDQSGWESYF
jgi:hypothetical protein